MGRETSLHPTDETLVSYGLGKLDDTVAQSVNHHLEQCVPCRRRVAELSSVSVAIRPRDAQRKPGNAPERPKPVVEYDPPSETSRGKPMADSRRASVYLVGGVIGALLVVGAVLIIRSEGEHTRETIRQVGKEAAKDVGEAAKEGIRDAAVVGVHEAGQVVRNSSGQVLGDIFGAVRGTGQSRDTSTRGKNGSTEQTEKAKKGSAEDSVAARPPNRSDVDQDKSRNDAGSASDAGELPDPTKVITNVFRAGSNLAKGVDDAAQDALKLDSTEEIELGKEIHASVLKEFKVRKVPDQQHRIERLARPLLAQRDRKEIEYTFTIIKNDEVNAFSFPGGHIYVHTALLDFAKTDAQLQFVLGHEIGHVDLKHCARNYTYAARAAQVGGSLARTGIGAVYHLYELQFNEELELQADEYAFRRMLKLGRTRDEALSFHRKFLTYLKQKGVPTAERTPTGVADAIGMQIQNHFRSHPPSEERIRRLEQLQLKDRDR
jgi:beta-barrel assembly-enhancing protease